MEDNSGGGNFSHYRSFLNAYNQMEQLVNPHAVNSLEQSNPELNQEESDGLTDVAAHTTIDDSKSDIEVKKEDEHDNNKVESLSREVLDNFTDSILEGCLLVLDYKSACVFRTVDLITVTIERNGHKMAKFTIRHLVENIMDLAKRFINPVVGGSADDLETNNKRFSTRLHLLCLLFEYDAHACGVAISTCDLISTVVKLLPSMTQTIDWLPQIVLLIDLYEKIAETTRRRILMKKATDNSSQWKFYEERPSVWTDYSVKVNKKINDAFLAGDKCVEILYNRQNYSIKFSQMLKMNKITRSTKPVMLSFNTEVDEKTVNQEETVFMINSLTDVQTSSVIESLVPMLKEPDDMNSLQAMLRLCLRLTRLPEHAVTFAKLGGIRNLLHCRECKQAFPAFNGLVTLIMRHVMETDMPMLRSNMEKFVKSKCTTGSYNDNLNANIKQKEFNLLLRRLAPMSVRNTEAFVKVMTDSLVLESNVLRSPNSIVKYRESKSALVVNKLTSPMEEMLSDLLETLIEDDSANVKKKNKDDRERESEHRRYLLNKSDILRILAEFVNSYIESSIFVMKHEYIPKPKTHITEKCSVLSYIFDYLLPQCQTAGDQHCPALTRVFLLNLAQACSSNHLARDKNASTDLNESMNALQNAQCTLVVELKASLQRSLRMKESGFKHGRIQSIVSTISMIIEITPPALNSQANFPFTDSESYTTLVNLFIKKGLLDDLAHVSHYLDLSSPAMSNTINAALRPLESLCRIVNQPNPQGIASRRNQRVNEPTLGATGGQDVITITTNDRSDQRLALEVEQAVDLVASQNELQTGPEESVAPSADPPAVMEDLDIQEQVDIEVNESTNGREVQSLSDRPPLNIQDVDMDDLVNNDDLEAIDVEDVLDHIIGAIENHDGEVLRDDIPMSISIQADEDELRSVVELSSSDGSEGHQSQTSSISSDDSSDDDEDDSSGGEDMDQGDDVNEDDDDDDNVHMIGIQMNIGSPDSQAEDFEMDMHDSAMVTHNFSTRNDESDDEIHAEDIVGDELDSDDDEDDDDDDDNGAAFLEEPMIDDPENGSDMEANDDLGFVLAEVNGNGVDPGGVPGTVSGAFEAQMDEDISADSDVEAEIEDVLNMRFPNESNLQRDVLTIEFLEAQLQRMINNVGDSDTMTNSLRLQQTEPAQAVPAAPVRVNSTHPLLDQQPFDQHLNNQPSTSNTNLAFGLPSISSTSSTGALTAVGRTAGTRGRLLRRPVAQPNGELHLRLNTQHQQPSSVVQRLLGSNGRMLQFTNHLLSSVESITGGSHRLHMVMEENSRTRYRERINGRVSRIPFESNEYEDQYMGECTPSSAHVATSLSRWTEEARVLDLDSIHDHLTSLKPTILRQLFEDRKASLKLMKSQIIKKRQRINKDTSKSPVTSTGVNTVPRAVASSTVAPLAHQHVNIMAPSASSTAPGTTADSVPGSARDATPAPAHSGSPAPISSVVSAPSTALTSSASADPVCPTTGNANLVDNVLIASGSANDRVTPMEIGESTGHSNAFSIPPLCTSQYTDMQRATIEQEILSENLIRQLSPLTMDSTSPQRLSADNSPMQVDPATPENQGIVITGVPQAPTAQRSSPLQERDEDAEDMWWDSPASTTTTASTAASTSGSNSSASYTASTITTTVTSTVTTISSSTTTTTSTTTAAPTNTTAGVSAATPEDPLVGVDPSFLAALPDNIREEVINEQRRLLRIRQNQEEQQNQAAQMGAEAVNPEFLAALPPSIQEEVLAQQRHLQAAQVITFTAQRTTQQRSAGASEPAQPDPIDNVAFMNTLSSGYRRQVLADMDNSLLAYLPHEMIAEANQIRQQMGRRMNPTVNVVDMIPRSATSSAIPRYNHMLRQVTDEVNNGPIPGQSEAASGRRTTGFRWQEVATERVPITHPVGRKLLDHESLSALLVLLFVNEPKIIWSRLHRVLRNLSYHEPTRVWIVQSLLSILHRTAQTGESAADSQKLSLTWLSITLEAALGCRANVFEVTRRGNDVPHEVTVNGQAAPIVCGHVLECLISLSRSFNSHFLPDMRPDSPWPIDTDFWDNLVQLDFTSPMHDSENTQNTFRIICPETFEDNISLNKAFEISGLGQLMMMLSHPVLKRNQALTDKLLKLLGLISINLPEAYDLIEKRQVTKKAITKTTENLSQPQNTSTPMGPTTSAPKRPKIPEDISDKEKEEGEISNDKINEAELPVLNIQLKLAVEVLTSKACSEDGLDDITSILLSISKANEATRNYVLSLMLSGAVELGENVKNNINDVLSELYTLHGEKLKEKKRDKTSHKDKNVLMDRYRGNAVVLHSSKNKHGSTGKELQLPSMAKLTSKASSQRLFLTTLKAISELREAARPIFEDKEEPQFPNIFCRLSDRLNLSELWSSLSECLTQLSLTTDQHAVFILQPTVEAFFLVHAGKPEYSSDETLTTSVPADAQTPSTPTTPMAVGTGASTSTGTPGVIPLSPHAEHISVCYEDLNCDTKNFLLFAEKHKVVLNQILRGSSDPLVKGPFSVLINHTKVLDFDVKCTYFRYKLEQKEVRSSNREDVPVTVRRTHVFEDSYRELHRHPETMWKKKFYIVFEDEEGQDAGGLLREWYLIMSREIFNPMYALFMTSPGDRVTYTINPSSHCNSNHLSYFKFVGRIIAKAVYDNKLLDCYFTRSFYKHILSVPVKYTDMESEDYDFYRGLVFLLENNIDDLGYDLTFSTEIREFGVTEIRDILPDGRNIKVTEEEKEKYVKLVCQMKMTGAIRKQIDAFLSGFYSVIPKSLISIFNEQELELIISGLPQIDVEELRANTEYTKYQSNSPQISWFWRALKSFDEASRARFLQFVTGTSKVPLQGFANLEGMNGVQNFQIHRDDRSTDRLPSSHTCFNQLDLPVYENYEKLKKMLLLAINECSEGFGLA